VTARVLITREVGSWPALASRFASSALVLQWSPTTTQVAPLDPRPGDAAISRLDQYDWLVATSGRGVDALMSLMSLRGMTRLPERLRVAAVGPATAAAFASKDVAVAEVAGEASVKGLAVSLSPQVVSGERVLIVRPEGATSALSASLRAAGARVDEAPLYRTVASDAAPELATAAIEGAFAAVAFTAPSAATLWLDAAGPGRGLLVDALLRVRRVAIGATTEACLASLRLPADAVAEAPTAEAVGDAIARALPSFAC